MQKKTKKKKKKSRQSKRRERKKIIKKTVQSHQPVTVGHASAIRSVLPFETAGMEKKIKKKKKTKNMKVCYFRNFFRRGSDLNFFLQIGSEKKNSNLFYQNTKLHIEPIM